VTKGNCSLKRKDVKLHKRKRSPSIFDRNSNRGHQWPLELKKSEKKRNQKKQLNLPLKKAEVKAEAPGR